MSDWYAVTDGEFTWDSDDDGPTIVLADGPEDAIQRALEMWKKPNGGWDFDSIQAKAARITMVGFQSIEIKDGESTKGDFWFCRS